MNRNGFTLVELLLSLALLGVVLLIGLSSSRNMFSTSLVSIRAVSDSEVFKAAKEYSYENDIKFDNNYACIYIRDLIDYGYLADTNDIKLKEKAIKLKKSMITKVISDMEYVDNCN